MLNMEDIIRIAKARFLSQNPKLAAELPLIKDDDACLITAEEGRNIRYNEALGEAARLRGIDGWSYQLRLVEELGHDISHLWAEQRRKMTAAIGMDDLS